jgi:Fur family transcriptional regulator, ferric uptake regulator
MHENDYSLGPVKVTLSPEQKFAKFLQSKGKRITSQRRLIVEQVFSHHDHFDADELLGHLQELITEHKVSRPTVYRTLGELTEAGLIRKMSFEGRSVYEHDYGYPRHDHLHCQVCDKLIEFHSEKLDQLVHEVAKKYQFDLQFHRMIVTGICEKCRGEAPDDPSDD